MSLSTLVVMTPLTLQNSLIKHITLCHPNRTLFLHKDIIFVYLHIIWNKSHGLKSILVDFYDGALRLQTHTREAKVLAATFPFFTVSLRKTAAKHGLQRLASSVLHKRLSVQCVVDTVNPQDRTPHHPPPTNRILF